MNPQTSESDSAPSGDAISSIATDLYDDNRPTPSQHAIDAERAEAESKIILDKSGAAFDPAQHASDKDGNPLYGVAGNFQKKRGRRAGASNKHGSKIGTPAQGPQSVQNSGQSFKMIGQATAESVFMAGRVIGGEDWEPIKNDDLGIDERAQMSEAWAQYAEAKQWKDIPPGVLVSIVMLGYIGPRLAKPKTKTRIKVAWLWLKDKFTKKPPKEPEIKD